MKKNCFILLFFVLVQNISASPLKYSFHSDKLYIIDVKNKAKHYDSKTLPEDTIEIRNFEKPVHVYLKITLTVNNQKYESNIIMYYGNGKLENSFGKDIKYFVKQICDENKIDTMQPIAADIQIVSQEIVNENCQIILDHNDIVILNTEIPGSIINLFN